MKFNVRMSLYAVVLACLASLMAGRAASSTGSPQDDSAAIPSVTGAELSAAATAVDNFTGLEADVGPIPTAAKSSSTSTSTKPLLPLGVLAEQGVWHDGPLKVGVAAEYTLPEPVDVPKQAWPTAAFPAGSGDPVSVAPQYAVYGLKRFSVLYSLDDAKILSIEPLDYDRIDSVDTLGVNMAIGAGADEEDL